jgi:hypothetical protein
MLDDVLRFSRAVWDAVVLPFIIMSIANLATDGWEAVTHLRETLVVLACFLCGCSHKSFPLSRSAVEAQRAALAAATKVAVSSSPSSQPPVRPVPSAARRRWYQRSTNEDENDADSEADGPSCTPPSRPTAAAAKRASPSLSCGAAEADDVVCPLIQRRLLLGKKGEVEEWLPALRSRLLVPSHYPLTLSRSLHQLISIVIGPIQPPTVATMPTRHPEPQWPPHFCRTGGGGSGGNGDGNNSSGGVGDPSTDDYSSSNSSATPNMLRHRSGAAVAGGGGGGVASAVAGTAASSGSGSTSGVGGGGGGSGGSAASVVASSRYRQASSVVYQRVSSRHLDFSNSRVAPHLIASITAHHVLSYPATRQKVLVMDLDETLCYVSTTTANMAGPPTFSEVIPTASGAELFHVWERPYARLFLATAAKLFNLVLFTSASRPYADTILQRIDPDHLLKLRFYRQDCRLVSRGLLRKLCTVAGMRATSSGSNSDHSSSLRATPLGDLSGHHHHQRSHHSRGVPSTITDDDAAARTTTAATASEQQQQQQQFLQLRRFNNSLGDGGGSGGAASAESTDVPSSGAELSADATRTLHGTARAAALTTHDDDDEEEGRQQQQQQQRKGAAEEEDADAFPVLAKTAMNEHTKVLVKDLRVLKVPPELLVMIDNSEECTLVNPQNALIVSPFIPALTRGGSPTAEKASLSTTSITTTSAAAPPTREVGKDDDDAAAAAASTAYPASARSRDAENSSSSISCSGRRSRGSSSDESGEGGQGGDAGGVDALLLGDDATPNDAPEDDEVLLALLSMLECLLVVPDVRSILRLGKLY